MASRGLSFGPAAEAYERFRFDYPDRLVDAVLSYARRPIHTALEIGAGTGKATRAFATRGVEVTATEPDPAMLQELCKHVPDSVTPFRAAFEELAPTSTYDLVFAGAALHWTRPERRWSRIADLLEPAGVFASFGGDTDLADPELATAVADARSPWLADDGVPSPDGTALGSPMQWPGTELLASDRFTDVQQSTIERRVSVTADDYLGLLSTMSAYLQLADADRRSVLARIASVLPDEVTVRSDLTLHLARRLPAG